jgi:hypothetical protein
MAKGTAGAGETGSKYEQGAVTAITAWKEWYFIYRILCVFNQPILQLTILITFYLSY